MSQYAGVVMCQQEDDHGGVFIDLRERALKDCDRGLSAVVVAAQFSVSRACVHRLVQRRPVTGALGPR